MRYKVTHTTTYDYNEIVPVCQNQAHLTPRNHSSQTCRYHRLIVRPAPSATSKRVDYFGNPVTYFAIHEGHRRLVITSVSKVDIQPPPIPEPKDTLPWETVRDALKQDHSTTGLANYQYCFDSPHIRRSEQWTSYARESFSPGRPILEGLQDLTSRIHQQFTYDPTATTVSTPIEEVMCLQRGVCQDLAHVQIACLRSLGLAARYVSGYLRTRPPPGQPRLVGVDASHAWLSLYCGEDGWVDADPTNDTLPSTDHITVAWGRDYDDVCPIHGMFIGGGGHAMTVAVDVEPIENGE